MHHFKQKIRSLPHVVCYEILIIIKFMGPILCLYVSGKKVRRRENTLNVLLTRAHNVSRHAKALSAFIVRIVGNFVNINQLDIRITIILFCKHQVA